MINMNNMYFDSEKFIKEMEEHEGIYEDKFDYDFEEVEEDKITERELRGGL